MAGCGRQLAEASGPMSDMPYTQALAIRDRLLQGIRSTSQSEGSFYVQADTVDSADAVVLADVAGCHGNKVILSSLV